MSAEKKKRHFYEPDKFGNDGVFLHMIKDALKPNFRVLDAGAGAGEIFPYDLKEQVKEMVGVDLDPRVESNPRLHKGIQMDLAAIPCDDNYFDVVFCRYVLEHIADPQAFLSEIHRVLKPGGAFLFLTPNKWHYVSLGARLTPHAFHVWHNGHRGHEDDDTFPTVYKLNSPSDLRREFHKSGFVEKKLIMRECCPNYLLFSWPSFLLGVAYERFVSSSSLFSGLRVNILGLYEKKRRITIPLPTRN